MNRTTLIYRSDLLPFSETFIAAQAAALQRYQPVFAGLRRSSPSLPLPRGSLVLAREYTGERLLFQQTGYAPAFRFAARAHRPSLIHAHFALDGAEALPLARALRVPLVVTLHGYDVMRSDRAHRAHRRGQLYLTRREKLWEGAALFVCVSEAITQRALALGFPREKLRTLHIGIDTAALTIEAPLPSEPRILFLGRLVPKKGCDVLLRAMEQVRQSLPEARLTIAGDGPERPALQALAARHAPNTQFVGFQTSDQVRALMRSSRCLAAPSLTAPDGDSEGLPTVLCEALALGLPTASSVHSGIPELIHHGEHGLLSPEGDVEALARNILTLCTDQDSALRFRNAGRARVERSFDLRTQTGRLEHLYDLAVQQSQAQPGVLPALAASAAVENSIAAGPATFPDHFGEAGRVAGSNPLYASQQSFEDQQESVPRCHGPENAGSQRGHAGGLAPETAPSEEEIRPKAPADSQEGRLRRQAAWLLSGNGAAILFQALYFLVMGRMLGAGEYGAFIGVVALVNVLSQFSSLGMEMVLLRTVARDRAAFPQTWGRALAISGLGFVLLQAAAWAYGRAFLAPALRELVPYLALSDALFGKLTQLSSRALQGAGLARWSAKLLALTNAARAGAAGLLFACASHTRAHVDVLTWARVYSLASLLVAVVAVTAVTRQLGLPRWHPIRRAHLLEGLSFSFSSSAISVYNDIDKTMLVSAGMLHAAGIYGAAYRVIDVISTPIVSLFAAASPRLFRHGAEGGPPAASKAATKLLRWTIPFGLAAAPALCVCAPALPRLFGHSFAGSTSALRFLCPLPLLRGLHYAWGTAITASASQWLRTAAQAGAALLNLLLNLVLIPRWGWRGAAAASLLTDSALALSTGLILWSLSAESRLGRGAARASTLPCAK